MKKILIVMMAVMPLTMWAQANTWEKPEVEETEVKKEVSKDAKYLKGAVHIVKAYLEKMTGEKNQVSARIVIDDKEKHELGATFNEWLVFKSTAIMLDQTRMLYVLKARCYDGKADIQMANIRYVYDENRNPQNYTAENWITDKEALNKKGTRVLPVSGKFRRKTIDRKDFLFNKFESLLK